MSNTTLNFNSDFLIRDIKDLLRKYWFFTLTSMLDQKKTGQTGIVFRDPIHY